MGSQRKLENERVASLPLRSALTVENHTVARSAVALMRSHSLGCAIIVDHNHNPLAIFTEQCVIALIQEMGSLDGSAVGRFADRDFLSAKLSDPILQVWELMQIRGAKLVCVTDDAGRLVGLTNQQRVAAYLAENI